MSSMEPARNARRQISSPQKPTNVVKQATPTGGTGVVKQALPTAGKGVVKPAPPTGGTGAAAVSTTSSQRPAPPTGGTGAAAASTTSSQRPAPATLTGAQHPLIKLSSLPQPSRASNPSNLFIQHAATALGQILSNPKIHYAVIGRAACALLDPSREGSAISIRIEFDKEKIDGAVERLAAHTTHFTRNRSRKHCLFYKSSPPVPIHLLPVVVADPPSQDPVQPTGKNPNPNPNPTPLCMLPRITYHGVKIARPTVLLENKCRGMVKDGNVVTGINGSVDFDDILLLLRWCAKKKLWPTAGECGFITPSLVGSLSELYWKADEWEMAGWDQEKGCWNH